MNDNMSQRGYKVSDSFIDNMFNTLFSNYLEREKIIELDAQAYQADPDEKAKDRLDKRISLAQKEIEVMLEILDTHSYDENVEYIKDNLRRKIDHLIEIRNGLNGMGLI